MIYQNIFTTVTYFSNMPIIEYFLWTKQRVDVL